MGKDSIRVLLVEDDTDYAALVKEMLGLSRKAFFEATIARNLKEGLRYIIESTYDLVLLDLGLPDSEGLDTFKAIHRTNPDIPLVVITGCDNENLALEAMRLGAQEYLLKGAVNTDLLEKSLRFSIERQKMLNKIRRQLAELERKDEQLKKSEEKYRQIFENIQDVYFEISIDGEIIEISPSIESISKYKREELIGKSINLFYVEPLDRQKIIELLNESGKLIDYEIILKDRDGTPTYCSISLKIIFDKDGNPSKTIGTMRNISERKKMEMELQASRASFHSIIEKNSDGLIIIDRERKVRFINPAAESFLRCKKEEVLGNLFCYETHLNEITEIPIKSTNGEPGTAEMRVIKTEWNGEEAYLISVRDITDRIRLQNQLQQASKMEAVGRLAGGIAHDFNNILVGIKGYTELLQLSLAKEDPLREYADNINASADMAAALVRRLLAFSRKQIVSPKIIDLNELITELENIIRRVIVENIKLVIILNPNPLKIKADPVQIEQIVMNLVANSKDAMPSGGTITIETGMVDVNGVLQKNFSFMKPGKYATLLVRDTGVGIDKQAMPHIFEPFFTTKHTGKTAGLGLPIVYGIVKQLDGFILGESEKDSGATFKIFIPLAIGESDEIQIRKEEPRRETMAKRETILVIEDNEDIRKVLKAFLSRMGYVIHIASDGKDALALAQCIKPPPDLLLTDIVLPDISGTTVAEALKKQFPKIKIIYMSGYSEEMLNDRSPFDEKIPFIHKPFSVNNLLDKIRETLDKEQ